MKISTDVLLEVAIEFRHLIGVCEYRRYGPVVKWWIVDGFEVCRGMVDRRSGCFLALVLFDREAVFFLAVDFFFVATGFFFTVVFDLAVVVFLVDLDAAGFFF